MADPTALEIITARVRQDLHDEDSSNYRWTTAVLQRHIDRALRELSHAIPSEQKSTLSTVAGTRDISFSSLTDLIRIVAVEYPTGNYPPTYVPFSIWQTTLTLLIDSAPSAIANVYVYWHKLHALATTTTLETWTQDILVAGAAGYAALDWASYSANRINLGGDPTYQHYKDFADTALAYFHAELRRVGLSGSLRTSRMYTPTEPRQSQSTDPGP